MSPLILVYTDDPERGGVAQYNHAVLLALVAAGYRAACVQTRSESPLVAAQRAAGVAHHWLPYDSGTEFGRTVTDRATPAAIFSAVRPDAIIFSDCCPASNFAAKEAALDHGIPYVLVEGFVAPYLAQTFASRLNAIAGHLAMAREVVAVSQDNLNLLRQHFGLAADRGVVIHYGRSAEFFRPIHAERRQRLREELGFAQEAVVGLTTARLTPVKGFMYQIAALELLDREMPGLRPCLVWLGEGEQRGELEAEIRKRNLQDRVKLPGHRWNMAEWYDVADMFILPSQAEGMPLAIMEAMAKGLPVVATAVSGIPEELGPTGQLLPDPRQQCGESVIALARTIALWTQQPEIRRRVGAAGRARAEKLFREEMMVQRTLALIARVTAEAPALLAGAGIR